jgi:hypothetical protein
VLINIVIKYTLPFQPVNFPRCGKPQLGHPRLFSYSSVLQGSGSGQYPLEWSLV